MNGYKWHCIGERPDLISFYPAQPEIFHNKSYHQLNAIIGTYGSGENDHGDIRDLTEGEARRIGLLDDTYEQVLSEQEVEELLFDLLG